MLAEGRVHFLFDSGVDLRLNKIEIRLCTASAREWDVRNGKGCREEVDDREQGMMKEESKVA